MRWPLPEIEFPFFGFPAFSLITVPTELSRILKFSSCGHKADGTADIPITIRNVTSLVIRQTEDADVNIAELYFDLCNSGLQDESFPSIRNRMRVSCKIGVKQIIRRSRAFPSVAVWPTTLSVSEIATQRRMEG
jgi:hypothetical protein